MTREVGRAKLTAVALWPGCPYINGSQQGNLRRGRSLGPCVDCRPRHQPRERRDLDKRRLTLVVEGASFGSCTMVIDVDSGVVGVRESTRSMAPKVAMAASSMQATREPLP
jgi:hypothetical protein